MTRAIGIDLGHRSIKIAEVEIQGKERILVGLTELKITPEKDASALLRDFFAMGGVERERIAIGLGSSPVLTRTFEFPFQDKQRVGAVIRGAFEDSLPFELDSRTLDFKLVGRKGRNFVFLSGLCPDHVVNEANQICEAAGFIPNHFLLDTEAMGQLGLDQCLPFEAQSLPYVLCDFGYSSTKVAIVQGTRPQSFDKKAKPNPFGGELLEMRTLTRGSRDVIRDISEGQKTSIEEAEQWLIHRAEILNSEQGSEQNLSQEISDAVKTALRPIIVEIYQTFQSFRGKHGHSPSAMYITGGVTRLSGFREFLAHELRLQVKNWPIFVGFRTDQLPVGPEQERNFAVALSLAHRYSTPKPIGWLNFRKSSQANKKILTQFFGSLVTPETLAPLRAFGIALAFVYAYSFVTQLFLGRQNAFLQKELASELRRLNPDLGKKADRLAEDPDRSRELFQQEKTKASRKKVTANTVRARSELLLDMSRMLPPDSRLKEWTVTDGVTRLEFQGIIEFKQALTATASQKTEADLRALATQRGYKQFEFKNIKGQDFRVSAVWRGASE